MRLRLPAVCVAEAFSTNCAARKFVLSYCGKDTHTHTHTHKLIIIKKHTHTKAVPQKYHMPKKKKIRK